MSQIWIDVDNPPQVQYLAPLVRAFSTAGSSVRVTARDNGITLDLLRRRGIACKVVGTSFDASLASKINGSLGRAARLWSHLRRGVRPLALVSSSRSAALAARAVGIPSFIICDYEFVDLRAYRRLGSYLLFPDVIPASVFEVLGFAATRLLPFRGLKEDVSFAGLNVEATTAHDFGGRADLARFVVRPAAERSHYHQSQSAALTHELLAYLAASESVQVVFAPRYPSQVTRLEELEFRNAPVVLDRPIEFVPLLKAADAVVSAGGTMLREAAMLGVPAYSTFQGRRGAVDLHLAAAGRLQFLGSRDDFGSIDLRKKGKLSSLSRNPMLAEEIVESVLARVSRAGSDAGGLQDVS